MFCKYRQTEEIFYFMHCGEAETKEAFMNTTVPSYKSEFFFCESIDEIIEVISKPFVDPIEMRFISTEINLKIDKTERVIDDRLIKCQQLTFMF